MNTGYGIDFGTNSCAVVYYAYIEGQSSKKLHYGVSRGRPFPSVVAIDKKTGEIFTGETAKDKMIELRESCVYISSVKSILDSEEKCWEVFGKTYYPVDIAYELFKALKENIEKDSSAEKLDIATVSIPINFSSSKRTILRTAAKRAGIEISSFVSEPTAAFFSNYNKLKANTNVLVFDWGGGTLDVSLIQNDEGKIYELFTDGLNIAGDHIDLELAKKIHAKIAEENGKMIAFDKMPPTSQDMLRLRAERAKIQFSEDGKGTTIVTLNGYGEYGVVKTEIDYNWFKEIVTPIVNKALDCMTGVIKKSGLQLESIDTVLLVGGSSQLRPLQESLSELLGHTKVKIEKPENTIWSVAEGDAILESFPGCNYSNQSVEVVLSDSTHFQLLAPDTKFIQNDELWKKTFYFGITDTTQQARIVFSGSKDIDELLDKYKILEVPTYQFLLERLELTARIDNNGVFCIEAKSSNKTKDFTKVWEYTKLKNYYKLPLLDDLA